MRIVAHPQAGKFRGVRAFDFETNKFVRLRIMRFDVLPIVIILGIVTACIPSQPSQQEISHITPTVTEQSTLISTPVSTNTPATTPLQPTNTPTPGLKTLTTQCKVIADLLNVCTSSPYENLFVRGMIFTPLARNIDGTWLQVQVQGTDQVGWVSPDSKLVDCGNLNVDSLPITNSSSTKTVCSSTPTTSIGVIARVTAIQPGSKNVSLQIQDANEHHTFFISLLRLSITDSNGNTYEFDCDIVNNCAWHQLSSGELPYQIDGILKQPIAPGAIQITLSLSIDRGETGTPYLLTWQQDI